jgi:hypothetical protein
MARGDSSLPAPIEGAAAAPALVAGPDSAANATLQQRRSDRVTLAVALEISGVGADDRRFTENVTTEAVSRCGCSILTRRHLAAGTVLLLKRSSGPSARVRVVGQVGIRDHGHVYGTRFIDSQPAFWGIYFPKAAGPESSGARALLRCSSCRRQEVTPLEPLEVAVLEANQRITRFCPQCQMEVGWQPVRNEAAEAGEPARTSRNPRTRMRAMACITQPGREQDLAQLLDISRGGICFRSKREYPVQAWIQVAVPYTPEAANIFVPGRIAWHRATPDGLHEHGVQYVKPGSAA